MLYYLHKVYRLIGALVGSFEQPNDAVWPDCEFLGFTFFMLKRLCCAAIDCVPGTVHCSCWILNDVPRNNAAVQRKLIKFFEPTL